MAEFIWAPDGLCILAAMHIQLGANKNISRGTLIIRGGSVGFLEYLIEQIKLHKVDISQIFFEITETSVIANLNKARQFMHALRQIGCRFSLDDFGSGLSSFAYLKNLGVDFLKIDGMFVKAIVKNKIDRAMVESINNVSRLMGLHTIAEFAKNDEIINTLKEIGVDYAQGYGVAKPELFE